MAIFFDTHAASVAWFMSICYHVSLKWWRRKKSRDMYRSGRGFCIFCWSWLALRFLFHNFSPLLIKQLQYWIWSTICTKTSKKSYATQNIWYPELDIVTAAASYLHLFHLSNTNCTLFEYISISFGFLFKSDSLWHAFEHYPTGIINVSSRLFTLKLCRNVQILFKPLAAFCAESYVCKLLHEWPLLMWCKFRKLFNKRDLPATIMVCVSQSYVDTGTKFIADADALELFHFI